MARAPRPKRRRARSPRRGRGWRLRGACRSLEPMSLSAAGGGRQRLGRGDRQAHGVPGAGVQGALPAPRARLPSTIDAADAPPRNRISPSHSVAKRCAPTPGSAPARALGASRTEANRPAQGAQRCTTRVAKSRRARFSRQCLALVDEWKTPAISRPLHQAITNAALRVEPWPDDCKRRRR